MRIKPPTFSTLRKYGLTHEDWLHILQDQNYCCPICERKFGEIYGKNKRPLLPVCDHEHIRNYKKMSPENRKAHIRGLPCNYCNRRRAGKGMNLKIARNLVRYLEAYEEKTNVCKQKIPSTSR